MIGQKFIHCILRVHKNPNFTGSSYNYYIGFYQQIITYDRCSHIPIMLSLPQDPNVFTECFVAKEIWIDVEIWIFEFFNIQTSYNTNSIFFRKHENNSIHRWENQMTSWTKQYVLTIRLYIELLFLNKTTTFLSIQIIGIGLFHNLDILSPTNAIL